MSIRPIHWCPAVAALSIAACAAFQSAKPAEKNEEKPAAEAPELLGRVASVPSDRRFVLIQRYGGGTIPAGTVLTTQGPEERAANLLATGESLGQFAAADLQSGRVEVGDAVYLRQNPAGAAVGDSPAASPELLEVQAEDFGENVQKNN